MPPQGDIWALFEKRPDPLHFLKSLHYKDDKTHYAAWCTGCLDHFVEVQRAAEMISLMEGSLTQDEVRTPEQWRNLAKNPDLASYSSGWKGTSNILDSRGVIPVVGKRDVMMGHISRCVYADQARVEAIEHAAAMVAAAKAQAKIAQLEASQNAENTPPVSASSYTSGTSTPLRPLQAHPTYIPAFSASPVKLLQTLSGSEVLQQIPTTADLAVASQLATAAGQANAPCSALSGCKCQCHAAWNDDRQKEFAADLCDLFVACNFSFNAAENPQTHLFFKRWVPNAKVPDRRTLSGPCLDSAVTLAMAETRAVVSGQYATGQSDGWKNIAKTSVLTSTMNVKCQAHLVRTHDMTGRPKTGQEHLEVIKSDIAYMETTYGVKTVAWVTDDGPDGKGARNLLRKIWPWMILLLCWAHQCNLLVGDYLILNTYRQTMARAIEVAKWFNNHSAALDLLNNEQLTTYHNRRQPLALLLPIITRWTAHLHAGKRILDVEYALKYVVMKHKDRLLAIAASSRSKESKALIDQVIETIEDDSFWKRLPRVVAHMEPLGIATNILQSSHARLDHVLFTLANLYHTYSAPDMEPDVRDHMLSKLEARWKKNADQDLFILAGFLNPYVRADCFSRDALSGQDWVNLAVRVFARLFGCDPEPPFRTAVEHYLERQGHYTDAKMGLSMQLANAKDNEVDILRIWKLIDRANEDIKAVCTNEHGLPRLAYRLLSAAVSTGDTERVFSDFGVTHTRRRNRLSPETVHKVSVVRKHLRRAHATAGLLPARLKRKLTSDGNEPSQSPTLISNPQPGDTSDANMEDAQDFHLLGEALVKSAIDSRAQMEVDGEDEDDDGDMGSGDAADEPTHTASIVDMVSAQSQPGSRSRKQKKSSEKTSIRLANLFLYPRAPPESASQSEKTVFEGSMDGDRLRRLHFIWTTGKAKFGQERQLNETLQRSSETCSAI